MTYAAERSCRSVCRSGTPCLTIPGSRVSFSVMHGVHDLRGSEQFLRRQPMSQCKAMQEIVLARGGEGDRVNRGNTVCIRAPLACDGRPDGAAVRSAQGNALGTKAPTPFSSAQRANILQADGWPVGPLTGDRGDSPPRASPWAGRTIGPSAQQAGREIFGTKSDTACPPLFTTLILIPFLWAVAAASYADAASLASFAVKNDVLAVRRDGQSLQVSLKSPALVIGDKKISGHLIPQTTSGSPLPTGRVLEVCYAAIRLGPSPSLEARLFLRWSETESVLRKWATIRLVGPQASVLLKEVVLDDIETPRPARLDPRPDGEHRPVFLDCAKPSRLSARDVRGRGVSHGGHPLRKRACRGGASAGREVAARRSVQNANRGIRYDACRWRGACLPRVHRRTPSRAAWIPRQLQQLVDGPIRRYTEDDILRLMKVFAEEADASPRRRVRQFLHRHGLVRAEIDLGDRPAALPGGVETFLEAAAHGMSLEPWPLDLAEQRLSRGPRLPMGRRPRLRGQQAAGASVRSASADRTTPSVLGCGSPILSGVTA